MMAAMFSEDNVHRHEAQQHVSYHVHETLYRVSSRIERELPGVERDGKSVHMVHPDDKVLALSQTYSTSDAELDLTHHRDPDGDGYITEIDIKGDEDRVNELKDDLNNLFKEV